MIKKLGFPRTRRLISKAEFKFIFDESFKVNQKHFIALFKPNQMDYPRLGLIVSKRVAKKAVTRNNIKRVIRESFRLNQIHLQGFDFIVIVRHLNETLMKAQLREGIEKLWKKLLKSQPFLSS